MIPRRARRWLVALGCLAPQLASAHEACDLATPELRLPFSREPREVIQGVGGTFSHFDRYRYAWDFAMPVGTPVLAAADGVVVEVIEGFDVGGPDRSFENFANMIVVDHGRDRFSVYQHLRRGGARVREGDRVRAGQTLGDSGDTGWSTRPHLHFSVIDHRNRSLPACFRDVPDGWPLYRQSYRGSNSPTAAAVTTELTELPRDAFAENGIVLGSRLPARWLGRATPIVIAGRTTRAARRVVAWFMPRGDGRATRQFYGAVAPDGSFTVTVDWRGLDGPQNFAISLEEGGRFHSEFSIPVALRERR